MNESELYFQIFGRKGERHHKHFKTFLQCKIL
jgi:hypothetical protein